MAGVYDNREMALLADHRHGADVQSVAGRGLIGADTALAEYDIWIPLRNDVLCCIEPFINGSAQASL